MPPKPICPFAETVRTYRKRSGWGLRVLASRCGMNHASLRELENGQFTPRVGTAMRIADSLAETEKAIEELLRIYLRQRRAGLLAELLVAEALRREGLNVTLQKKHQSRKSPAFGIVVDAGEHLKIGIVVKVIKRE